MSTLLRWVGILLAVQNFAFAINNFKMERLAVSDELTQNSVSCIYQDHLGYLWIGTLGGLNRYDGETVQRFIHDPHDSASIPHDMTAMLFENTSGELLLSTLDGLASFDPHLKKWTTFYKANFQQGCPEGDRYVWLTTADKGIVRYDLRNNKISEERRNPAEPPSLSSDNLRCCFVDKNGWLWIGYDSYGVECFAPGWSEKKSFSFPRPFQGANRPLVRAITQDALGRIWIGSEFHGLLLFENDRLLRPSQVKDLHLPKVLEKQGIYALLADANKLWIGAASGLYLYDVDRDDCTSFSSDESAGSDSQQAIRCLYKDRQGLLWAGGKNGLYKIVPQTGIRHFHNFIQGAPPGQNRVWSFLAEGDSVWIGTDLGLVKWRRRQDAFTLYTPDDASPNVRSIKRAANDSLYILTLSGSLFTFDGKSGKFANKRVIGVSSHFTSAGYCLWPSRDASLWLGMNAGGLFHYLPKTGALLNFPHPSREISKWVLDIEEDASRHSLWCGTWQCGLQRFDLRQRRFYAANNSILLHTSGKKPTIFCIDVDGHGDLWLGTYGDGLLHFEPDSERTESFTIRDGLPANVIYSMVCDDDRRLWLGTTKGLALFNPATQSVKNYSVRDGLQGMEFNVGAAAKTPQGELLFGGPNGFNLIEQKHTVNIRPPQIALKQVQVFGKTRSVSEDYEHSRLLTFSYKETFISLVFAVLHFKDPERNRLKYRIVNLSDEWISLGRGREISLTQAKSGIYHIELLAANSDGVWMPKPYRLTVRITPPFWKRSWFFIGVGLALAGMVGGVVALNLHRRLEIQRIKERERDEMRQRMARDFHDVVGSRLTKITMISHLLQNTLRSAAAKERLSRLTDHANAIYSEMHDFIRGINAGRNTLYDLAAQVIDAGREMFDDGDISFEAEAIRDDYHKIDLPFDCRINLLRIFKEAMHNSLKHSGASKVFFRCQLNAHNITLQICDDGRGFDESALTRVNGLQNMKKRCSEIGAELVIDAKKGQGVCISVSLNLL